MVKSPFPTNFFRNRHFKKFKDVQRKCILVLLYRTQFSVKETARRWKTTPKTIKLAVKRALQYCENIEVKETRGVPKKLGQIQIKHLHQVICDNPRYTHDEILTCFNASVASKYRIKKTALKSYMKDMGFKKLTPFFRPELKDFHKRQRREYVFRLLMHPMNDLIFIDEKNYYSGYTNRTTRVWVDTNLPKEEKSKIRLQSHHATYWKKMYIDAVSARYAADPVLLHDVIDTSNINLEGKGGMNGKKYHSKLVKVKQFLKRLGNESGLVFVQDGAPSHRTGVNMEYLHKSFHYVLQQPGYSPELNALDAGIYSKCQNIYAKRRPGDLDSIEEKVDEVWEILTRKDILDGITHARHNAIRVALAWGDSIGDEHSHIPRHLIELADLTDGSLDRINDLIKAVNKELRERGQGRRQYKLLS